MQARHLSPLHKYPCLSKLKYRPTNKECPLSAETILRKKYWCGRCRHGAAVYCTDPFAPERLPCQFCRSDLALTHSQPCEVWQSTPHIYYLRSVQVHQPPDVALFQRRIRLLERFSRDERSLLRIEPSYNQHGLVSLRLVRQACLSCGLMNRLAFLTNFAMARSLCEQCGAVLCPSRPLRQLAGLDRDGVCHPITGTHPLEPLIRPVATPIVSSFSRDDAELLGLM
jgi:hypothetical protein